ncbi:NADH-quinone oxidoreductase subunit E [Buchnera aphidicola (Thelaxes suberi)]|uniref:NADH-quinone oxidoreductase subunit NuoE n=1 Tax=Buchnera aphidicola TaxID=9 RepID=UPI003464B8F6
MKQQLLDYEIIKINNIKKNYENSRAAVIDALKILQERLGWIPDWGIQEISIILNISSSDVESIATFYSQIFRKPVGKYIIRLCDSIVCYITGYDPIEKAIIHHLKIKKGCTTNDKLFTFLPICCLGSCDKSPVVMINKDIYYNVNEKSIITILDKYK